MHALIVLAHPEPRSFNGQLARTARAALQADGHSADLLDLAAEGFDPREGPAHYPPLAAAGADAAFNALTAQRRASEAGRLPPAVADSLARLERADLLLLQFPLWWFSMPALLKGWLDRVFVYGGVYASRRRYDSGHFRGKRALVSVTTGGAPETHGPDGRQGDLDLLLWPLHFALNYVGFSVLPPFRSFAVEGGRGDAADRAAHAAKLAGYRDGLAAHLQALDSLAPLAFNGWDDWDAEGRLKPEAPSHGPFMRHCRPAPSPGRGQQTADN